MNRQEQHLTEQPAWIDQAKTVLDDSARDLDATTLSRLNRARQTALAAYRPRPPRVWLLPAGLASAACALLLAFAVWQPHRHAGDTGTSPTSTATAAKSGETDATDEASPEFYQNLEFYAWLDAQNKGGDG
ncbi:MAG: hypothetical protein J0I77_07915 [Rudaea sp.]|uniref:hypothetical protein n=1 Tax=unclassified Rudaea TaxID=2627037 RepID=UPI0010F9268D|nr:MULTISPECIES: hypothetical protein [unclassified Rudaea]MBN8885632.1 hypothetical protein [Rudaea sp.]MBR0344605.1 hypothetical protein [Rudaea sp.]